uniref:uncharacterized protein LOC114603032 isoform X1 n=1 Tax=Podarcis muralis TaxID=64176 RepID=UPI0010A08748|nr:uncharacterized protein LOC114603032 isoform X1 [Podarcis muralis]
MYRNLFPAEGEARQAPKVPRWSSSAPAPRPGLLRRERPTSKRVKWHQAGFLERNKGRRLSRAQAPPPSGLLSLCSACAAWGRLLGSGSSLPEGEGAFVSSAGAASVYLLASGDGRRPARPVCPSFLGGGGEAAPVDPEQGPVCFEDVAVHFTDVDWALLHPDQRALHKEVREENRGISDSLITLQLCCSPFPDTESDLGCRGILELENSAGLPRTHCTEFKGTSSPVVPLGISVRLS